jgi:hypothetical protein
LQRDCLYRHGLGARTTDALGGCYEWCVEPDTTGIPPKWQLDHMQVHLSPLLISPNADTDPFSSLHSLLLPP